MTQLQILSVGIFLLVMAAIVSEKVHRTVAAVAGGVVLVCLRVLTVEEAMSYIDFSTLGVLIGMMLFVAVVRNSGLFEYVAIKAAKIARGDPWRIMLLFTLLTASLSAFLDNVTTVLLVGPMAIAITGILELDPVPFLLTQILASNIGGTATLIGDPPNIMIGSQAGLGFMDFVANTGVAVVFIMIAVCVCFYFMYGRKMAVAQEKMAAVLLLDEKKSIKDRSLLIKSVVMIALVILGFVFHDALGVDSCVVALAAAVIMMLIGKQDVEEIILGVEWSTILFFTGLFVVVGGMVQSGVITALGNALVQVTGGDQTLLIVLILWGSAIFSSFLDNIPFVATMIPLILSMQTSGMEVTPLWWALSLGACLGGNGTLIGASANVVLSGISAKHGHPITFSRYLRVGFPIMLLSVVISTAYLLIRF
ncbi:MAG: ArsB/NhaD family transporter [Eubacteriales bacterium]|nr:ArsB/NhaD family transporter [Eubacteriales bacterium]